MAFEAQLLRRDRAVIRCAGLSRRAAQTAAQALVGQGVSALMSFGIAGGLDPAAPTGMTVIDGNGLWAARLCGHFPFASLGKLANAESVITTPSDKAALLAATGALAVDMESAGVAEIAAAHGLPFIAVRVVADTAHDTLPPVATAAATIDGRVRMLACIAGALMHPSQIPDLIRLGRRTAVATAVLRRLAESDALYSAA